jgi:hypothetical protein
MFGAFVSLAALGLGCAGQVDDDDDDHEVTVRALLSEHGYSMKPSFVRGPRPCQ